MIDFVSILQKLPINLPLKTRAQKLHADLVATYGGMITKIDERMKRGEQVPDCLVKTLLLAQEEEGLDHLDMAILCSAFMIGGVETVRWFRANSSMDTKYGTDGLHHAVVFGSHSRIPRDSGKGSRRA